MKKLVITSSVILSISSFVFGIYFNDITNWYKTALDQRKCVASPKIETNERSITPDLSDYKSLPDDPEEVSDAGKPFCYLKNTPGANNYAIGYKFGRPISFGSN